MGYAEGIRRYSVPLYTARRGFRHLLTNGENLRESARAARSNELLRIGFEQDRYKLEIQIDVSELSAFLGCERPLILC